MTVFEKSLAAMEKLFARDCQFALATAGDGVPSVREVDVLWDGGAFYVVTYALSRKVRELASNPKVALCHKLHGFRGDAANIGHPGLPENQKIRAKLVEAFAPWYFRHNDEGDPNMCYVKIVPAEGFFHLDGTGYRVDFAAGTAEEFPFESDIVEE